MSNPLNEKPKYVKTLWLIRGVSGSGKSTVAEMLGYYLPSAISTEADKFRYIDGKYAWDKVPNHVAHLGCRKDIRKAVDDGMYHIVVSNTSTRNKDVNWYKNFAKEHGYRFMSLIVENYHETGNTHGVPEDTLCRMEQEILGSIKLK